MYFFKKFQKPDTSLDLGLWFRLTISYGFTVTGSSRFKLDIRNFIWYSFLFIQKK